MAKIINNWGICQFNNSGNYKAPEISHYSYHLTGWTVINGDKEEPVISSYIKEFDFDNHLVVTANSKYLLKNMCDQFDFLYEMIYSMALHKVKVSFNSLKDVELIQKILRGEEEPESLIELRGERC